MAAKVTTTYTCDYELRGEKHDIPDNEVHSHDFTIDGRDFTIDLCDKHNAMWEKSLDPWIGRARIARPHREMVVRAAPRRSVQTRNRSHEIRAWAGTEGIKVNAKGRIPANVINRYELAHGRPSQGASA